MLELLQSGLISMWLQLAWLQVDGQLLKPQPGFSLMLWPGVPGFVLPGNQDPITQNTVQQYLQKLSSHGITVSHQGIWMQSGLAELANYQGTVPRSAASLTKVATSLVALQQLGPNYQFATLIKAKGPVTNGVVQGDLLVIGSGDPLFVWEEAIAVGNALNQMGIKRVNGNLIVSSQFYMNYEDNPRVAGELLLEALDATKWSVEATEAFSTLPQNTPKPQVEILGQVKVATGNLSDQDAVLLLRHQSPILANLIKEMNKFSNNEMAHMLAHVVGGSEVIQTQAADSAGVPENEIQLINGSGLGVENRISPRAVGAMLVAIQSYVQKFGLSVADLFPIAGFEPSTVDGRKIPPGTVVKTGTLSAVSALAGVIPSRDRGLVWFAIINSGDDVDALRDGQDELLQQLIKQWGTVTTIPKPIAPHTKVGSPPDFSFGDPKRNEIFFSARG